MKSDNSKQSVKDKLDLRRMAGLSESDSAELKNGLLSEKVSKDTLTDKKQFLASQAESGSVAVLSKSSLQSFANKLHSVGSKPHLSRRQKRHMLREILPQKPLFLRLAPTFTAAFFAGVLMVSSFSFASQPGDLLYGVRRNIEDIRSTVQPSYDEQLLKRRDEEIKNLTQSSNNEDKINIVNKEKQEIEGRLREHEGSSTSDVKVPPVKTEGDTPTGTKVEDSDSHRSENSGLTNTLSTKEQCIANLDALKKAGQNVSSDEYKKCDNL